MTTCMPVHVKNYRDPARARAAAAHHRWLADLCTHPATDTGIQIPQLIRQAPTSLTFSRVPGRHPGPSDLPHVAAFLARTHAAAHQACLRHTTLTRPHPLDDGTTIPAFPTGRRHVLRRFPPVWQDQPAAFYKDANLRNFILTDTPSHDAAGNGQATEDGKVVMLDFDDLTLAPFGYDLAKLVVSTAMTHGRLPPRLVDDTLHAYTATTLRLTGVACPLVHLRIYCEIHHLLTRRYRYTNGYTHAWPRVRPWPRPVIPTRRTG
jgi:Ser/Thr protein kinase RdoA (MazF antagonist)